MLRPTTGATQQFFALAITLAVGAIAPGAATAQSAEGASSAPAEVTFHKDIEPILQRSCQNCHREDSVAPMELLTY